MVHFHKSFGVMQELWDHRDFQLLRDELHGSAARAAPLGTIPVPAFLDLGCAPGGFSASLLQDHMLGPHSVGFGVSLPAELGGFPMAYANERLCVQLEDILGMEPHDLMCHDNSVDMCCADAQNLSNFFKQRSANFKYGGLQVRSRTLGIWALTVKECKLAFAKLRTGGAFVFRFGWRGTGEVDVHPSGEKVHPALLAKYLEEEEWYKALTHWLFSVLKSLFKTLRPFKSEYVHQADVSFYMVCRGFDREKYESHNWEAKLHRAFLALSTSQDEAALVEGIKNSINDEVKAEINDLLDYVGRMRAIGIESRKITAAKLAESNGIKSEPPSERSSRVVPPSERSSMESKPEAASENDGETQADSRLSDAGASAASPRPKEKEKPIAEDKSKDKKEDKKEATDGGQPSSSSIAAAAPPKRGIERERPKARPLQERWPRRQEEGARWVPKGQDTASSSSSYLTGQQPTGAMQGDFYDHPAFAQDDSHYYGGGYYDDTPDRHTSGLSAAMGSMGSVGSMGPPGHFSEYAYQAGYAMGAESQYETYVAGDAYGSMEHMQPEHMHSEHMHSDVFNGGLGNGMSMETYGVMDHMHADPIMDSAVFNMGFVPRVTSVMDAHTETVLNALCSPSLEQVAASASTSAPSTQAPSLGESSSSLPASSSVTPSVPAAPRSAVVDAATTPAVDAAATPAAATEATTTAESPSSSSTRPVQASAETRSRGSAPAGDVPAAAAAVAAAPEATETVMDRDAEGSSDDDAYNLDRRFHRHKRRAGRIVRERRMGRAQRNRSLVSESSSFRGRPGSSLHARIKDAIAALADQGGLVLPALRFGLFCAMACSLNSIMFSVLDLYRGGKAGLS